MIATSFEEKWNIKWIIFFFSQMTNNVGYLAWPALFLRKTQGLACSSRVKEQRRKSFWWEASSSGIKATWKVMWKPYPVSSLSFLPTSSETDAHPSLWKLTRSRVAVNALTSIRSRCAVIKPGWFAASSMGLCLWRFNQLPVSWRGHCGGGGVFCVCLYVGGRKGWVEATFANDMFSK